MALIAKYDIQDIITHEEIDKRGWKTDPGPAFPQPMFKDLLGQDFDTDQPAPSYRVIANRLNFRGGPDGDADKVDPPGFLPEGTTVEIIRRSGVWAFVTVSGVPGGAGALEVGMKGWIHTDYVERVF